MTAIMFEPNVAVPLDDGPVLAASLYRPDDDHPHPALLSYYPYRKDDVIGSLFDQTRRRFAGRGYADLLVDMAGTGGSRGNYGETFNLELEGGDAAEIVEWVAAQPWCDGNVGVWGVSYGGFMALASACERPPHLKAIVAVYATTDHRRSLAPDGCPPCFGMYSWAAHMLAMDLLPPTYQDSKGHWRRTWDERLRRMKGELPHGLAWQVHPPGDEYWTTGRVDASDIEVPTMLIAGWHDVFTDAMLEMTETLRAPHRTVVGPWLHVVPHLSEVEPWDWVGAMSAWWDRYLTAGVAASERAEPPVLYFAQGAKVWRGDERWPPTGTSDTCLFLAGDRLQDVGPPERDGLSYTGDATVGVAAGIWDPFGTGLGWPEEQSVDDIRSLTFTSEPLSAPMEVAGKPAAQLYVSVEEDAEAQLCARLSRVSPDGRSTLITRGSCRIAPRTAADGPGAGSDIKITAVTVPLAATCFRVAAGERLRLAIATADFPHLWPIPTIPRLTVWCGAGSASSLRLPVTPIPVNTAAITEKVARPPAGPDPGWAQFGKPAYAICKDRTNGETTVSLGLAAQLSTPAGAVVRNDEIFSATVSPRRPDAARLEGRSTFEVDMPGGEKVIVQTEALYTRQASVCHGNVTVDGAPIFDHSWSNWANAV